MVKRSDIFKKISLINTIKCGKTLSDEETQKSYKKSIELKTKIDKNEFDIQELYDWMNTAPIVTEKEINEML